MTSKLTRDQLRERAQLKAKNLTYAISQSAFAGVRSELEEELQFLQCALACLEGVNSEPDRNPVLAYADSYRDMAKQGVEAVPIWSVITDLERNIAPLYRHAQPAPVAPEEWTIADAVKFCKETGRQDAGAAMDAWNACRAAMLQELKKSAGTEAICRSNENVQAVEVQSLTSINTAPDLVSLQKKAESIIGNYPGIPDSYVLVPMRLTAENGAKGALSGEFSETKFVNCPECFGDDECETCDGSGRIEITVPVTWTTIKDIWAKGVEHFAAAPQEEK